MTTKLLVVEDDEDLRAELVFLLEEEGYDVLEAASGAAALDLLRRGERPALILLDQMMPVMSGSEFRAVQREDPELGAIPVVLMTASTQVEVLAREVRPHAVVKKPMRVETLLGAVRSVLRDPKDASRER